MGQFNHFGSELYMEACGEADQLSDEVKELRRKLAQYERPGSKILSWVDVDQYVYLLKLVVGKADFSYYSDKWHAVFQYKGFVPTFEASDLLGLLRQIEAWLEKHGTRVRSDLLK